MEVNRIVASLIIFSFIIYLGTILQYDLKLNLLLKSETPLYTAQPTYEVKPSEEEAKAWTLISQISETLASGEQKAINFHWNKPYDTQLRIEGTINILPAEYYQCYWYECKDCYLYTYDICTLYKCTIEAGTKYMICQRTEIRQWKCVKQTTTTQEIVKKYPRTIYVRDGPDVFDWWDPDYFEVSVNDYPWNALATDPAELDRYILTIRIYLPPEQAKCLANATLQYGVRAYDAKIIYEDGTEQIIDRVGFGSYTLDASYAYLSLGGSELYRKRISRIEIWEQDFDISRCGFQTDSALNGELEFYGEKTVTVTDVQYVTKSDKIKLEQQGYTCTPYVTEVVQKPFNNPPQLSCDIVKYTTNISKDGKCDSQYCYWYCDPEFECYPPQTVETGTKTTPETYVNESKEVLYSKGCADANIQCIQWDTTTGTYNQLMKDLTDRDATNIRCSQWSTQTYKSLIDKTKTTGTPPYTVCDYKTQKTIEPITDAECGSPIQDTIKSPAEIVVDNIRRQYYATTTDTLYVDVGSNEIKTITLRGAEFTNFPDYGKTVFSLLLYALEQNPYIISDSIQDITPEGVDYVVKKYVAQIYSPGDIYAWFYPPVCSQFEAEGLKYRFTFINGKSYPVDLCEKNVFIPLQKGINTVEIEAYSIDPKRFESCIERPKTCEEQDLYGCPEQCKVKNIELECPSALTIKSGVEKAKIKLRIYGESDGFVRITVEGKGVYSLPEIYEIKKGRNEIEVPVKYYYYVTTTETTVWKITVENPASYNPNYVPDIEYCEIQVTVVPKSVFELLKRPEFIISIIIIIVGLILAILLRK